MECNKDEAIRAKEIAETKMQSKDYLGARKIALKAQQLHPALENISQLLMVCDVHLSAESKGVGNEKNFYEILKIESTADKISIEKQYRKFALLLHPDKNKFAGASDAYKLIGEAQRVLLDRLILKNWRTNWGPPQDRYHRKPNNGVKVGSQRNANVEPRTRNPVAKTATSVVRRDSKAEPKVTAKVNGKRKKQIDESSESFDSDSISESEEEDIIEENGDVKVAKDFGCSRENLRRSSRIKTNVSYKENLSDDKDLRSPSKKVKSSGSFRANEDPVLDKEVPNSNEFEGSSKHSKEDDLDKVKPKAEKENDDLNATKNWGKINVEANGDGSSPGKFLAKNKIVDGLFGDEAEMGMDGKKALSFDVQNGKPKIKLSPKVLNELRKQWKNSLIVKLFGKTIEYDTLCSKARALWKLRGDFKALDLGDNYISFTFESIEDRIHVYTKGPWVVMDHLLSVRKWEPNFKPSEARTIMRTAVWVRFRELPLEFLNDEILYIVAKPLGIPIKVDNRTQGNFARVCVEIDLGKPLCPVIEVEGKDCMVEYESLSSFCFDCSHFGHIKDIKCCRATNLQKSTPITNNFDGSTKAMVEDDLNKARPKENEKGNENLTAVKNERKQSDDVPGTLPNSSLKKLIEYPESDFNEFEEFREEECFAVGQVWALYSTLDTMPRTYCRISKIISISEFKMSITWLEPDPSGEEESKWIIEDLPVSCGNFNEGCTQTTDNPLMFSHQVDLEKGSKNNNYKIYPRKGETWALFKNWNMNWQSNPESKRKYMFEFVEILSDYHDDTGVSVAYLSKIKGFSCLFCRTTSGGGDSFQISRSQLFRFSHQIPSFLLSGEERNDVPKDSFELDPASLPSNIEEIDNPKPLKAEVETIVISESDSSVCEVKDDMESDSEGNSDSSEESIETFEVPDPEFYNFVAEKSPEKFQPGQFWALYGDEDRLPKYYAFIKNVNHEPQFELHVTWLIACSAKSSLKYTDKLMPIGCGMFMHSKSKIMSYTETSAFSHRLNVEPTDKMNEFAIYPRKGEVWAVYKNWNLNVTCSDLKNCKYDIVEILEENDLSVMGVVLEMVDGHNLVFKARKNNGSLATVQIERSDMLKLSHQIPSFRLTGEKGGSLNGCWELDPAALPIEMFCSH